MSEIKFEKEINQLLSNLDKIPEEFFIKTDGGRYEVLWFMDRQRPLIEADYSFDEERFGVTNEGKIIWGFDSGCSCPSPWSQGDHGDDSYNVKTWKEFVKGAKGLIPKNKDNRYDEGSWFDEGWEDECYDNLKDYLILTEEKIDPLKVIQVKNAEVRRFLMKRIGYDKIRNHASVKVIHTDGTSELLEINGDKYVKVKDSSTDREYLLYVRENIKRCKEGIAWTFNLSEDEYKPIMET